jgi:hypothetical protein
VVVDDDDDDDGVVAGLSDWKSMVVTNFEKLDG